MAIEKAQAAGLSTPDSLSSVDPLAMLHGGRQAQRLADGFLILRLPAHRGA
ncbi:MAG: hypothetical protein VKK63_09850 [Synechococcus sp.]|nr:hypothetical protein [Synechococcus sp.]